ncbi:hypothetical protein CYMTET_31316, partial [Cymbomonas tetramitiformis]
GSKSCGFFFIFRNAAWNAGLARGVQVWEFMKGDLRRGDTLIGHTKAVHSLESHHFPIKGQDQVQRLLWSMSEDGCLKVWDLATGTEWDTFQVWECNGYLADEDLEPAYAHCHYDMLRVPNMPWLASGHGLLLPYGSTMLLFELQFHGRFVSGLTDDILALQVISEHPIEPDWDERAWEYRGKLQCLDRPAAEPEVLALTHNSTLQ